MFLFLLSCFVVLPGYAQKIAKREVDKFTKQEIIVTSKETLFSVNYMASGFSHRFEFQIKKVDNIYSMPARILLNDIVKYDEESGISFLLDNEDVVSLLTVYTGISGEKFGNGYWFDTCFLLSEDDVNKLKTHKVVAVRIHYMGGSYDREIKANKQELIMKSLLLFK